MRIDPNVLRRLIAEALLNAYNVLGVASDATDEEIKKAWRRMMMLTHPDRNGSQSAYINVNKAYDRLKDKTNLVHDGPDFEEFDSGDTTPDWIKEQPPKVVAEPDWFRTPRTPKRRERPAWMPSEDVRRTIDELVYETVARIGKET